MYFSSTYPSPSNSLDFLLKYKDLLCLFLLVNQTEYQALLNQSPTFRGFAEKTKQAILSATGEQFESYIRIFTDELKLLKAEAIKLVQKNEDVLKRLEYEAKKALRTPAMKQEQQAANQDMDEAEKLMQNL